jgi:hypothetical protein
LKAIQSREIIKSTEVKVVDDNLAIEITLHPAYQDQWYFGSVEDDKVDLIAMCNSLPTGLDFTMVKLQQYMRSLRTLIEGSGSELVITLDYFQEPIRNPGNFPQVIDQKLRLWLKDGYRMERIRDENRLVSPRNGLYSWYCGLAEAKDDPESAREFLFERTSRYNEASDKEIQSAYNSFLVVIERKTHSIAARYGIQIDMVDNETFGQLCEAISKAK